MRAGGGRPWVTVQVDPLNHAAWVTGPGARDLILTCGGRPLWLPLRRAWATSERTARDVLALADANGYAVRYERVGRDRR